MTTSPLSPAISSADQPQTVHAADMSGAGMAMSSGQFIAGLLSYGQLAAVGTPRKLAEGLLPDMDADARQEVVDRLLAIGFQAGRLSVRPELHGEELARMRDKLRTAGFHAMGGQVARSLNTVVPVVRRALPVDGESARGH
jgi:hypothetical protein